MLRARERMDRTWTEPYQYLLTSTADCLDRFILQSIYECAPLEIKRAMKTRLDRCCVDHFTQAWEPVDIVGTLEVNMNSGSNVHGKQFRDSRSSVYPSNSGGGNLVANAVENAGTKGSVKRCWRCDQPGHLKKSCNSKNQAKQAMFALAVGNSNNGL
ncbi:unnamed protein product [Phytophthora fragariaefolia]|uniref:Unnamed protein product n=1 Tax=Phytophthora fragariaefolia TaxID=1490495 RepID=A0A9W6U0S7_9STRA|nr:unnamed protein product [Phytophthora fragariaefolia]